MNALLVCLPTFVEGVTQLGSSFSISPGVSWKISLTSSSETKEEKILFLEVGFNEGEDTEEKDEEEEKDKEGTLLLDSSLFLGVAIGELTFLGENRGFVEEIEGFLF